jgi:hypothetical protein
MSNIIFPRVETPAADNFVTELFTTVDQALIGILAALAVAATV